MIWALGAITTVLVIAFGVWLYAVAGPMKDHSILASFGLIALFSLLPAGFVGLGAALIWDLEGCQ